MLQDQRLVFFAQVVKADQLESLLSTPKILHMRREGLGGLLLCRHHTLFGLAEGHLGDHEIGWDHQHPPGRIRPASSQLRPNNAA